MTRTKEDTQKKLGAFYTPYYLAEKIVADTIVSKGTVCDPSCGDGVFLEAAANFLLGEFLLTPEQILGMISGVDINIKAINAARARMASWYLDKTGKIECPENVLEIIENNIICADAFELDKQDWPNIHHAPEYPSSLSRYGYHYIIGNPPFLNQLSSKTALPELKKKLNEMFGISGKYTDISIYFYFLALDLLDSFAGKSVNMIQPISVLSSDGAGELRDLLLTSETTIGYSDKYYFNAKVKICTIKNNRETWAGSPSITINFIEDDNKDKYTVSVEDFVNSHLNLKSNSNSFSPIVAALHKYPIDILSKINTVSLLGEHVTATAGFRDEYYEIVKNIKEKEGDWKYDTKVYKGKGSPVISTGMIDPNTSKYGKQEFTIGGKKYKQPVYFGERSPKLQSYLDSISNAHFVVATQTKVIEAMQLGLAVIPLTPIISITIKPGSDFAGYRHHNVLAILLSPVASFYAYTMFGGGGMGGNTMKLSAKNILTIPIPNPWSYKVCDSLSLLHKHNGVSKKFGYEMCKVYGLDDDDSRILTEWWWNRLPANSKLDDT